MTMKLLELANNLKEGIPFATPVFDGAKENDITSLLRKIRTYLIQVKKF